MFDDIIIKEVLGAVTVYSKKGCSEENINRKSYGISFCKSGKITYIQNGIKYISDENCVIILPKGGSYKILRQETGFFPVINFECENFYTDKFLTIPISNQQTLIRLYNEISECFYYKEKLKAKSLFYRLLAEIANNGKGKNVSRAVSFIYKNIDNPLLNNKTIAKHLNFSETYLNKLFWKESHTTPKKFIQKTRMEKAKKLLSEDEYTVNQIAEMCGFCNIYSFSRAFKNYTGKSATEYKKHILLDII